MTAFVLVAGGKASATATAKTDAGPSAALCFAQDDNTFWTYRKKDKNESNLC
jgi:hypothetical protein